MMTTLSSADIFNVDSIIRRPGPDESANAFDLPELRTAMVAVMATPSLIIATILRRYQIKVTIAREN